MGRTFNYGWVIVAAGPATRHLVPAPLPLHAVRGQVTGVLHGPSTPALPPFATNGHGALIPVVPTDEGPAWFCGSTFDRSREEPQTDAAQSCGPVGASRSRGSGIL